jgi:multidrug resistance efflux pump
LQALFWLHIVAGDLIIRLSAPEPAARRTPTEATLHSAEAQLATAQLDLRNADAQITSGSFANVVLPIQRPYPTLFVPSSAVT